MAPPNYGMVTTDEQVDTVQRYDDAAKTRRMFTVCAGVSALCFMIGGALTMSSGTGNAVAARLTNFLNTKNDVYISDDHRTDVTLGSWLDYNACACTADDYIYEPVTGAHFQCAAEQGGTRAVAVHYDDCQGIDACKNTQIKVDLCCLHRLKHPDHFTGEQLAHPCSCDPNNTNEYLYFTDGEFTNQAFKCSTDHHAMPTPVTQTQVQNAKDHENATVRIVAEWTPGCCHTS